MIDTAFGDWTAKVTSLLIVVFGIAYIVAGTFVTTIPTDQAALSGSMKCGVWGLVGKAQGEAQNKDALIQGQKETRAGQYARDCYGPQPAASLGQCSIFMKPYVPAFREKRKLECPFLDESYCAGDGFTAAKFTTDLADAASIGINAKRPPKFNRTTICVPLNLRQGFVERTEQPDRALGLQSWGPYIVSYLAPITHFNNSVIPSTPMYVLTL